MGSGRRGRFPARLTNVTRFLKLPVDGPVDLSIIRPTSGADETENSLVNKELPEVSWRRKALMKQIDSGEKGG